MPTPTPTTTAAAATPAVATATATSETTDSTFAAQKIRLYYFRDATNIVKLLKELGNVDGTLKGMEASNLTEDELILYGSRAQRDEAWRIVAALDLPRPGVDMEMWGVQISSNNVKQMEYVVPAVREQISRTQQAVRDAYLKLEQLTLENTHQINPEFDKILIKDFGYTSALDKDRPLALTDILLRMIATSDPSTDLPKIANEMNTWFESYPPFLVEPKCRSKSSSTQPQNSRSVAFEKFFRLRGLEYTNGTKPWINTSVDRRALQSRHLVADFAFAYGWLVHQPQRFSAYRLQQSADALNSRLQLAIDALNADIQDMFVTPTLQQIGKIVRCYDDVEYAQVGKVSMATLSGVQTVVDAHSVNVFTETPPFRLSDLLTKAGEYAKSIEPFDPAKNTVGALSLPQFIGLIAALGEDRDLYRQMKAGVSVTLTPNVLRNMRSAELKIDVATGDPVANTAETKLRPLSRVSQHDVKTSVYVNALDFFDLSAFDNQATLGGGRGYVPIIGPIWKGIFGEIPVAGKLFSWQRAPKTVYTDSLILTTSFITPTAMGIALLYPTELPCNCRSRIECVDNSARNLDNCEDDSAPRTTCVAALTGIIDTANIDAAKKSELTQGIKQATLDDTKKKELEALIRDRCFKDQQSALRKYLLSQN